MLPHRHNNKWNINELLTLQREYELLEMSIQEIAVSHSRTVEAILFRLQSEKFIDSWIDAKGYQEYSKTMTSLPNFLKDEYNIINYDSYDDSDHDSSSNYNLESDKDSDKDSDYETDTSKLVITHLFNKQISNITSSIIDIKCMLTSLVSKFNISSELSSDQTL